MLIATLLALLAFVCITVELTASCYPVRAEWRNGYGVVWMVDGGVYYSDEGAGLDCRLVGAEVMFYRVRVPCWRACGGRRVGPLLGWACDVAMRRARECGGEWTRPRTDSTGPG